MGEIERLRDKATHARRLAEEIADAHARAALRAFADELESKATELERLTCNDCAAKVLQGGM